MATILGSVFEIPMNTGNRTPVVFAWSAETAADGTVTINCSCGPSGAPPNLYSAQLGWGSTDTPQMAAVTVVDPANAVAGTVAASWGAVSGSLFAATFTGSMTAQGGDPIDADPATVIEMVASPGAFLGPVTPNLARVIAQAADAAFVETETFYVVSRWENVNQGVSNADINLDPYNVQPPADSYDVALCMVEQLKGLDANFAYGIFGPFRRTARPSTQQQVASIGVTTNAPTSPPTVIPIDGIDYDAMFWSVEVVQKMVVPYYAQEYGPDFANNVLREFNTAPVALVMHLPWSEYTEMSTTGQPEFGRGTNPRADPAACNGTSAQAPASQQPARRKRYVPGIPFVREDGTLGVRVLHPPR